MPIERSAGLAETAFEALAVFGFKDNQAGVEQVALGDNDDVVAARDLITTENLSYQSFSSISLDGPSQLSSDRDSQTSGREPVRQNEECRIASMNSTALRVNFLEFWTASNSLVGSKKTHLTFSLQLKAYSLLTDRRLRPFARRRFSTRRPFFVLIRTRKPCVRLRCRVFGWKVRFPFIVCSSASYESTTNLPCYRPPRRVSIGAGLC